MSEDKTKNIIQAEIAEALKDPPSSFTQRIEAEVEKRVEERVKGYKVLATVVFVFVGLFLVVFYNASQSTIRQTVAKELSENKVVEASKRILEIQNSAENAAITVSNSLGLVKANEEAFLNRLSGIKGADNVVLIDDLSKLFIIQAVTNFDSRGFDLDFEPIPNTVMLHSPTALFQISDLCFGVNGKKITFTSDCLTNYYPEFKAGAIKISYVRKSPH